MDTDTRPDGAILLHGAPIRLTCTVWETYPAGDHDIIVLRVEELAIDFDQQPLVWHRSALAVLS